MTDHGFIATLQYNAYQEGPQVFQHRSASYVCEYPGETRYVREYKRWNSPKAFTAIVCIHPNRRADGSMEIAVHFVEAAKIILSRRYRTCTGALNFLARTLVALDSAELLYLPCPWEMNKKERAKWERSGTIPEAERRMAKGITRHIATA